MSTYRLDGIKYNPANWSSLAPSERAACARFAAARERELNTITATEWTCIGGPFAGSVIEIESTTEHTAAMTVGAWCGRYELTGDARNNDAQRRLEWKGNDAGAPVNTHGTSTTSKAAPEVTARGFDKLRDLLGELAEDPAERATTTSDAGPTRPSARYTIGRTTYTIPATAEAVQRLRARIVKAKRWFADKLLTQARPSIEGQTDALTETTPDALATMAATVAIAQAQASSADAIGTTGAQADAEADAAELVTCEAGHAEPARAASHGHASSAPRGNTPAGSGSVPARPHTPTHSARPGYSHPVETQSDAGDDSHPVETQGNASDEADDAATLAAEHHAAASVQRNTQQASSKRGAWSATMYRTSDGRSALRFTDAAGQITYSAHPNGADRMRALQTMAQAAEQAATAYDQQEADKLREHARGFTPEQCEQAACNFERDNNHGAALVWRCMGAQAFDLAARAAAYTRALNKAGQLTPALSDQRAAIAADLRARIASDCTQVHETQAPDCNTSPETQADDAPAFQRARPANVDLRALIAQGMAPADLVGLGVVYSGDMANASGHGAIVEAHDGGARGVLVAVTLEDGRHMAQVDWYSFADRPGNRYALDWKRHGAPYLAELAAKRAGLKAATSSAKEIKAQRHAAELERLAAEFPHLERADSRHAGGKLAARNIRTLLKSAFPGQKFSVTSDYSCVRVRWTDGPVGAAVDAIIDRFDIGRADYNTDYFYTESSAWSELFGGVQYLFTSRDESPELVARVLETFNAKHGTSATPDDWRKQSGPFNAYTQRDADAYRRWFREMLNATDATLAPKARRSAKT